MATKRQRIDTMIDAHVWMCRQASLHGEWPTLPVAVRDGERRSRATVRATVHASARRREIQRREQAA
jgi:hypothetical protein